MGCLVLIASVSGAGKLAGAMRGEIEQIPVHIRPPALPESPRARKRKQMWPRQWRAWGGGCGGGCRTLDWELEQEDYCPRAAASDWLHFVLIT